MQSLKFSQSQVSVLLRALSKNVLSLPHLYEKFSLWDTSLSLSEFQRAFRNFSYQYLKPYKNKSYHLIYTPLYIIGVKYFLRQVYFYFPGYYRGDYYFLSSMNYNLFHDFLMSVLSSYLGKLGLAFSVHYSFAGRDLSNDLVIPKLKIAFEVETGLKTHISTDLNQRLGIVPVHQEHINKRFVNNFFTYVLVPNDDLKIRYFKYFTSLSDKFGFSVFETYKFNIYTFYEFSKIQLI